MCERMSTAERASEASSAQRANDRAVRADKQVDQRMAQYSPRHFLVILPIVQPVLITLSHIFLYPVYIVELRWQPLRDLVQGRPNSRHQSQKRRSSEGSMNSGFMMHLPLPFKVDVVSRTIVYRTCDRIALSPEARFRRAERFRYCAAYVYEVFNDVKFL